MRYNQYKLVNESFNERPLGVTSKLSLDEAKKKLEEIKNKKKKMFGDEMPKEKPDMDDDGDGDEDDMDMDMDNKDKECPKDKGSDDEDVPMDNLPMEKKGQKKQKKMKEEDMFGYKLNVEAPMLGTPEYEASFFNSLKDQFGELNSKHDDGVQEKYEEDVLLSPHDRGISYDNPGPGQVGFAPQQGITSQMQSVKDINDWERNFTPYTAEDFIEEKGLTEEFEKWIGQKVLREGKQIALRNKKR